MACLTDKAIEGLGVSLKNVLDFRVEMLENVPTEDHYSKAVMTLDAVKDLIQPSFYDNYRCRIEVAIEAYRLSKDLEASLRR